MRKETVQTTLPQASFDQNRSLSSWATNAPLLNLSKTLDAPLASALEAACEGRELRCRKGRDKGDRASPSQASKRLCELPISFVGSLQSKCNALGPALSTRFRARRLVNCSAEHSSTSNSSHFSPQEYTPNFLVLLQSKEQPAPPEQMLQNRILEENPAVPYISFRGSRDLWQFDVLLFLVLEFQHALQRTNINNSFQYDSSRRSLLRY